MSFSNYFPCFGFLDFFRFPISLALNGQEKTSTTTGKLMTVGILIFLLYSFQESNVVNKTNPISLTQEVVETFRPSLFFSKENFTLVLGVADGNNNFLMDETLFSLLFISVQENNTDRSYNQRKMLMKRCTQENFQEFPQEFERLGLEGTFCLPISDLILNGFWDEPFISYFYFELRTCENSSESNVICQSPERINDILKDYYIDIYLTNNNIDPSDYYNPISRTLKIFYKQLDLKFLKSMDVYLKNSRIETDDGFFFESIHYQSTFEIDQVDFDVASKDPNQSLIYQISIYSSHIQKKVTRNYQKIQTLLAQLGGICNFLFILGFMFSKIENRFRLITILGNELFIFPKIQAKVLKLKKKKSNMETLDTFILASSRRKTRVLSTRVKPQILTLKKTFSSFKNISEINHTNATLNNIRSFAIENEMSRKGLSVRLSPKFLEETEPQINFHESVENNENEDLKRKSNNKISRNEIPDKELKLMNSTENHTDNQLSSIQSKSLKKSVTLKKKLENIWKTGKESLRLSKNSNSIAEIQKVLENLEHYQNFKHKENYFSIGFLGFLKLLIKCKRFFLNSQEKLFLRSEVQIAEQMDILKILKKLQEIEKLKRIVLDDEQLYLFNLVSKPMIIMDDTKATDSKEEKIRDKRFRFSVSERPNMEKEKLKLNYGIVQRRAGKSCFDQRIIKLLDEDVMCFLKNKMLEE